MKITKFIALLLVVVLASSFSLKAQESAKKAGYEAITMEAIQGQLEFLASDWTEGRETGTKGAYMAADYIASMFQVYGLQPGGDTPPPIRRFRRNSPPPPPPVRTYFQNFSLLEYWPGDIQEFSISNKVGEGNSTSHFNSKSDFSIQPGQTGFSAESDILFVGYGISDANAGYDELKGVDLEGKIIIRLSGHPGHLDSESEANRKFRSWRSSRMRRQNPKDESAKQLGVLAVIEFNPHSSVQSQWGTNTPFRYNTATYEGDTPFGGGTIRKRMTRPGSSFGNRMPVISITAKVFAQLMDNSGFDLESFELNAKTRMKSNKPSLLENKTVKFKTSVNSRIIQVRNVVGVIEGEDTENIIVIGGHYDHLGIRDGWIYNGADDNASGTVGVMTIAKAMIATGKKPKKTIVFCAWTGEEKGLLGSSYFVDNTYNGKNV